MDENEKFVTKCNTEDFAKMVQLFRILTEAIDFSRPFKIVISYDPEQPRMDTELHMPTEALERHIQKVRGSVQDQNIPPKCNNSNL